VKRVFLNFKNSTKNGGRPLFEDIYADERNKNAFRLMLSLNMLIETDKGFDFTGWAEEVGFSEISKMPLAGPSSAIIAIK